MKRYGSPDLPPRVSVVPTCEVDGCERKAVSRRYPWCHTHYSRWKDHGDPLVTVRDWRPREEVWEEYVARVTPFGCWEWSRLDAYGYGYFRDTSAYRWVYTFLVGPVPEGLDLDHLCRNRACVNPEHLEPVTHAENLRRAAAARRKRTICPNGHPYTPETTRWRTGRGWQERVCRICENEAWARSRERAAAR